MSIPCPRCGTVNQPNARFCKSCGLTLDSVLERDTSRRGKESLSSEKLLPKNAITCPNCGTQNRITARFCSNCRASLNRLPAPPASNPPPPLVVPTVVPGEPLVDVKETVPIPTTQPRAIGFRWYGIMPFIILGLMLVLITIIILLLGWGILTLVPGLQLGTWAIVPLIVPVIIMTLWLLSLRHQSAYMESQPSMAQRPTMDEPMFRSYQPTVPKSISLHALARVELGNDNNSAFVGHTYLIQAGVGRTAPREFEAQSFSLSYPKPPEQLEFDIVVHASNNLLLQTDWHGNLTFNPLNPKPQLLEFKFTPQEQGYGSIIVDFYLARRWLKSFRFELYVFQEFEVATA